MASAIAWFHTRAAIYGAGLAFALVEGILRTQPTLFPAGALQAGSYAALLALSVPLITAGQPAAARLATACRWACIGPVSYTHLFLVDDVGVPEFVVKGLGHGCALQIDNPARASHGANPSLPRRPLRHVKDYAQPLNLSLIHISPQRHQHLVD